MLYLYCQSLIKDIKTTSMPEVISPQSRTRCVLLINDWRLNYRLGAFYTPWITSFTQNGSYLLFLFFWITVVRLSRSLLNGESLDSIRKPSLISTWRYKSAEIEMQKRRLLRRKNHCILISRNVLLLSCHVPFFYISRLNKVIWPDKSGL